MNQRIFIACAAIALSGLALAIPALAHGEAGGEWGHHGMMGGPGGWLLGPLMMLVMIGAIVAVVVLVVRWLGGTGFDRSSSSAQDILEQRFARGEIDEEEYRKRKRALEE